MTSYPEFLKSQYGGVIDILRRYWSAYGRLPALLTSPFFHCALFLTAGFSNFWVGKNWWETSIAVLPSLLGFSLAGIAILMSFGGEGFQRLLARIKPGDHSVYTQVGATFTHFIVVQTLGLLVAIAAKSLFDGDPPNTNTPALLMSALGAFLLVYSIFTGLAAGFAVFRMTAWFTAFSSIKQRPGTPEDS